MRAKRKNPDLRREMLLYVAVKLAAKVGYQHLTRKGVAKAAKVSAALISKYFGTIDKLKKEVIRSAIANEVFEIIAQGLSVRDPSFKKISAALKRQALEHMAS